MFILLEAVNTEAIKLDWGYILTHGWPILVLILGAAGYIVKLKRFIRATQETINDFVAAIDDNKITDEEITELRTNVDELRASGLDLLVAFMKKKNGK